MYANAKKTVALSLAALTLGFGLAAAAAPAAAHPIWPHHGFNGGFFGAAMGLGLLAGMVAAQSADDSCVEHRPTFDRWGHYIGQREVDYCR